MVIDLVYDVEKWCWYYQACDIKQFAPPDYQVALYSSARLEHEHSPDVRGTLHFSCLEAYRQDTLTTVLAHHGPTFLRDDHHYQAKAAVTENRNLERARECLPHFRRIICVNPKLHAFALTLNPNSVYLPAGVNMEVFTKQPMKKHKRTIVGWCGQADDHENTKGYHSVLQPLMEMCSGECDFILNTRNHTNGLTREQMVDWYRSVDVFICTSSTEGTPMPPLEAMACGRAVISTPVGDMPEIITPGINGYLVPEVNSRSSARHTVHEIAKRLRQMRDYEWRLQMGESAHATIRDKRNWIDLAPQWLAAVI